MIWAPVTIAARRQDDRAKSKLRILQVQRMVRIFHGILRDRRELPTNRYDNIENIPLGVRAAKCNYQARLLLDAQVGLLRHII